MKLGNMDWDLFWMKAEIKYVEFRKRFWSKLAMFAGEKALDAMDESKELMKEAAAYYPELMKPVKVKN